MATGQRRSKTSYFHSALGNYLDAIFMVFMIMACRNTETFMRIIEGREGTRFAPNQSMKALAINDLSVLRDNGVDTGSRKTAPINAYFRPGIMPFILRIIFIMPPLLSFFIIDCI